MNDLILEENEALEALAKKTGLSFKELDKAVFDTLDIQPEDVEAEDLSHFPQEEIWVAACRIGVLNSDIVGLSIIERS